MTQSQYAALTLVPESTFEELMEEYLDDMENEQDYLDKLEFEGKISRVSL